MPEKKLVRSSLTFLGELLNKIFDFIRDNFQRMPRWVQVFVYLLMVGLFIYLVVDVMRHDLFEKTAVVAEPSEVEILGSVMAYDGNDLPDSMWPLELYDRELYVRKQNEGDHFRYIWFLKIPRSKLGSNQRFKFLEYNPVAKKTQQKGPGGIFSRSALLELSKGDPENGAKLFLNLTTYSLDTVSSKAKAPETFGGNMHFSLFPEAYARTKTQKKTLSTDSGKQLLWQYEKSLNPAVQMEFRATLPAAGASFMVSVAESLRSAVTKARKASISDYALALADYDSLVLFTSSGPYRSLFDDAFYAKAVELLHTGNEFDAVNMATFLRELQDARLIPHLFREYRTSKSTRAKRLCLFILEAFSTNTSKDVKRSVADSLKKALMSEQSEELKAEIKKALSRY